MSRLASPLAALFLLAAAAPVHGQVVETSPPAPVRTDESVTITFHADRGNEGLEDCDCTVYAHTGLNTSEGNWRYIMDEWPNNRPKTKLTQVGDNTYELTIPDIREYYSDNNTGFGPVPPESEEEIQTMNFVFRNADGSKEGKTADGGDIFVEVNDVQGSVPGLSVTLQSPSADPPLYPFITPTDTTVDVSVTADTANVDAFDELRLLVDGQPVDSTTSTSLTHPLSLTQPGRFQIRAEARASVGDSTLTDSVETRVIRSPNVVDQDRPAGVEDGINYNSDGSITLSLFAPEKEFAYVIGDFTDWEIDNGYFMKREQTPNGPHWWITLDGLDSQAQHDFQYYVGGASHDVRVADPFAHKVRTPVDDQISDAIYPGLAPYPSDETEGLVSVLQPDQSDFDFSAFESPTQEDLVIYELLLRDFVEQSSFSVLTDTLSYLDSLGVNAVELMPVSNFEGHGFWGYRPNAHLAMDKSYGPPEGLKQFVEAAHDRGIAVILDVVYNHITSNSAIARLYESAAENPFLESGPNRGICGAFFQELNQGHPFVKTYIRRANAYWLEEFNVDGFRFDVAHCVADNGVNINDPGHDDALRSGWKAVADSVWSINPDAYMTLELFVGGEVGNDLGGYGGVGNTGGMLTWHNMNDPYSHADRGALQEGSNLSGSYFGFRGFDQPSGVTYMTSHDEQWLMRLKKAYGTGTSTYSTADLETAIDRQKLVGAFFFTVPGPRMLWQFGEVGYGWGPNECLRPFAGEDPCPPSAPVRIGPKPVRWDYADPGQSPERAELYDTWKALIHLRNEHEVFSRERGFNNDQEGIKMKVADGDVVRCVRLEDENLDALIVGNFGLTPQSASVEVGGSEGACSVPQTGTWHNFFENDTLQVSSARQFQLRPGEFRVYTSQAQPAPPMGLVPSAPIYETSQLVSSSGTVDFGETGMDVRFSGVSNSTTVTVEKLDEAPLGTDGIPEQTVSQYRYVLEADGDLDFDDGTEIRLDVSTLGGVDDANNVTIYQRPTEDTGSFTALTTSYNSAENELVAPISSGGTLGEFVLASNSEPLPVELSGLSAQLTGSQTVALTWRTARESGSAGFRVQRRTGGASAWTNVGFVESKVNGGTTSTAQTYRYTDVAVPFAADSVRYRLQQVDADGSTRVSNAVTVELGAPDEVMLAAPFPNPAAGRATVRYALPQRQPTTIRLYDLLGRRVRTVVESRRKGRHEQTLDLSGLPSGTYFLRLQAGGDTRTRKLTVLQ